MTTKSASRRTALRPTTVPRRAAKAAVSVDRRRILLATDGSDASAAAIRFARVMEEAGAWTPEALTVREPVPVAGADVMLPAPVMWVDIDSADGPVTAIHNQLRRMGGAGWTFQSEMGSAPPTIVDVARQHKATMIVMGLGKHGKLARLFGAETAARVCRLSDVPVLAVDARAKRRPKTLVVAMDFGASSVRAAHEAVRLVEPGGHVHLLHVRWGIDGQTLRDDVWEQTYAMGVEQGFLRLVSQLREQKIRVTWEFRIGGVLESILAVAKDLDADVIAAGSHNQNVVDRLLLGSTPATLLRGARCSVLVAPPARS